MIDMLTAKEMASLDRALRRRTHGRIRVGVEPLSVAQAQALWYSTASFVFEAPPTPLARLMRHFSLPTLRRDDQAMRRLLTGSAVVAATASLGACATLGGNIKGDFACRAPNGICAPTTTIDDAALALIAGEPVGVLPAGPYTPSGEAPPRTTLAAVMPVRSGEKVLRIVFPAHIDQAGRFRETTAVHAVVERGAWMTAGSTPVAPVRPPVSSGAAADQPVETSSVMPRSLGELAASAPEVRFPDAVADADAQIASAEVVAAPPVAALRPSTLQHARGSRSRRAAAVLAAAPSAGTATVQVATRSTMPTPSISYSLPSRGQAGAANPMDAIRAQVAGRLAGASPMGLGSTAAPIVPQPGSSGTGAKLSPAQPVNGPSLFPVSEVNR